jgi:hypothetical protein
VASCAGASEYSDGLGDDEWTTKDHDEAGDPHHFRPNRPARDVLLGPLAADPGTTDDERRIIAEMMAKATYG